MKNYAKFSLRCAKRESAGSNGRPSKEDMATQNIALKRGARTLAFNKGTHERMQQTLLSLHCDRQYSSLHKIYSMPHLAVLRHKSVNSTNLERT